MREHQCKNKNSSQRTPAQTDHARFFHLTPHSTAPRLHNEATSGVSASETASLELSNWEVSWKNLCLRSCHWNEKTRMGAQKQIPILKLIVSSTSSVRKISVSCWTSQPAHGGIELDVVLVCAQQQVLSIILLVALNHQTRREKAFWIERRQAPHITDCP